MKHVTYADKAVLMGDDAADALFEYARLIADIGGAGAVTLRAIRPDGNTVDVSFLLSASTTLLVESTNSEIEAPSNEGVVSQLKARIAAIERPPSAEPGKPWIEPTQDFSDYI